MSAVPNVTAQFLVKKALQKIGVINNLDPNVPLSDMQDGLDGLWQLLDSFNGQSMMIPYITQLEFPVNSSQRTYTIGPGGDFDTLRPLEIVSASWRDNAGSEWPISIVDVQTYVEGDPYKETSQGRPYTLWYNPTYPTATIELEFFPLDQDQLLLKVLHPFTVENCPCCDFADCETGCVDPACPDGNVDPDLYTITVAGCPDGDDACILSGQTQMTDYLENQCSTDCNETFTQDFLYDPGTGDITITATATPTPRTSMKPTQLCLTEKTEFPPGYQNMIIWNLAAFMAPEYNMEVPRNVAINAARFMKLLKKRNARPKDLLVDNALTYPGRTYNIFSGPSSGIGR